MVNFHPVNLLLTEEIEEDKPIPLSITLDPILECILMCIRTNQVLLTLDIQWVLREDQCTLSSGNPYRPINQNVPYVSNRIAERNSKLKELERLVYQKYPPQIAAQNSLELLILQKKQMVMPF